MGNYRLKQVFLVMEQTENQEGWETCMQKLGKAGISCRFVPGKREVSIRKEGAAGRSEETGEKILVITDSESLAEQCRKRGTACIGYQPSGSTVFFSSVRMVVESPEAVNIEELEHFFCRFYGFPVVIAETSRIRIRESIPEDFEALYLLEQDQRTETSAETQERMLVRQNEYLAYIKQVYSFFGYGYWTVELKDQKDPVKTASPGAGKIIGRCGLCDYEPYGKAGMTEMRKSRSDYLEECGQRQEVMWIKPEDEQEYQLELGYAVAEEYRRQGYGCEMCRAVLAYAFEKLDADAVLVKIFPDNVPSLQLAWRLGFHSIDFDVKNMCSSRE